MSWAQRGMVAGLVGLGVLVFIAKSGGNSQAGLDPKKSPIKGATYAAQVPVYAGAKLEDEIGGNYYENLGGPVTFTSHSWFFAVRDPMQRVVDFYAQHLPPGAKRLDVEEGEVLFEWRPSGSVKGEEVTVRVSEGKLQIGEVVRAAGN